MPRHRTIDRHLPQCMYLHHGNYRYVKNGKKTSLGRNLLHALEAYGRIMARVAFGNDMQKFFEEGLEKLIRTKSNKLAEGTIAGYWVACRHLVEAFRDFTPELLKSRDVRRLKRLMHDRKQPFNTMLTVMRQIYDLHIEDELLDYNPCTGVEAFTMEGRKRKLLQEEFDRIHAKANAELKVMMDLSFLTGQRVMAVAGIELANLRDDAIYFPHFKTKYDDVKIEWNAELRAAVAEAKALHGKVAHLKATTLFYNIRGKPLDYKHVNRIWLQAARAAGLGESAGEEMKVQMRDLRAMSATELDDQGGDSQAMLGHREHKTTKTYLRNRKTPKVKGPRFPQVGNSKTQT